VQFLRWGHNLQVQYSAPNEVTTILQVQYSVPDGVNHFLNK